MVDINVKYLDPDMPKLEVSNKGDWIDVRAVHLRVNGDLRYWEMMHGQEYVDFEAMDVLKVGLGFAAHFGKSYEAHLRPRSSLFANHGLLMTNGLGVIDHTFCGDGDEWFAELVALFPGRLWKFERICQFRLIPRMQSVNLKQVEALNNPDRGGTDLLVQNREQLK